MSLSRGTLRPRSLRALGVALASGLALTASWSVLSAPALADDGLTVEKVVTTSNESVAWKMVGITAEWHADNPQAGQTFTVTLGKGLQWPARLDMKLVNSEDESVVIGTCDSEPASQDLTCTLNSAVEQWDEINGTLWANAQFTSEAVPAKEFTGEINGKTFTIVAGDKDGDGVCDEGCDGVIYPRAEKSTYKVGWYAGEDASGASTWLWDVNVAGATNYTVTDANAAARVDFVQCTDSDWGQAWRPDSVTVEGPTATWSVASEDSVCQVRFRTVSPGTEATNSASVNGQTLPTATATALALGGGNGTGMLYPAPTPSESTSEAPTPSETPSEVPSPAPTQSQNPVVPAPQPSGAISEEPAPTTSQSAPAGQAAPSTPAGQPATTKPAAPELAKTGAEVLPMSLGALALVAGGGTALAVRRRRG